LYLFKNTKEPQLGFVEIPLADVKEIRIIEHDTGKTIASYLLTGVGVIAAAYAVLVIIVLLTKSSCPYV
jgi:hypothetical protein